MVRWETQCHTAFRCGVGEHLPSENQFVSTPRSPPRLSTPDALPRPSVRSPGPHPKAPWRSTSRRRPTTALGIGAMHVELRIPLKIRVMQGPPKWLKRLVVAVEPVTLAQHVPQKRTALKRSQTELADLLGCDRASISRWRFLNHLLEHLDSLPDLFHRKMLEKMLRCAEQLRP